MQNAEWWISAAGFQLGDVWGRVSRGQCSWPPDRAVSSTFLPSALQSAKDRAKLTQKQLISEVSCYQYSGNLHCGFSMVTGPECKIRLRRKLLKAHGLYSCTIQAHALEFPPAEHWAWRFHLSLKAPATSLSTGCLRCLLGTGCLLSTGGTETLGYGSPRSLCWCGAPELLATFITLHSYPQVCDILGLQLGFSRVFVSESTPRKRLQFSVSSNLWLYLL